MNLLWKFNILLFAVFGLGLACTAFEAQRFLERQAQDEVLREANLMSASANATRSYTEHQIMPLLEQSPIAQTEFLPQTIPFFAATMTFQDLRQRYPNYTYKEAALNPTNLRDRATDWEADIINYFRNDPGQQDLVRTRESATGTSLYLAHPIRTDQSCLQCHSQPALAPATMIARYGNQNGFGWGAGEVVGAQIIAVPTSVPQQMARKALAELMLNLTLIFLLSVALIDAGLYFIVVRPLRTISANANTISQGDINLDPLQVRGQDEVAQVTRSFNRMHTSLKKAMDLLNG